MLAEMPRQTVNLLIKRRERRGARMLAWQARLLDLLEQIQRVGEIAVRKKMREAVEYVRREIQRFADFARGAAATIRDDVRRHRRAVFAVTLIDLLNHALAPVPAWQININVRPAFSTFAKESLEQRVELERVNGRDAETKANRTVRRAAAALGHDVVLAAEPHEVRDDQEVTRETEFRNEY